MEQRISLLTLGVDELGRARAFYERLGWAGQETEETVFFQAGGIAVVLWSREKLAADCGLPDARAGGFDGIAIAHNLRSTEEVDALLSAAEAAGGVITRPAAETFYGGYAGVFCDPDGHAWEIAHNPGFELRDDGTLVLPRFDAAA
jgi:predicted lactoylglutathione lyase